MSTGSRSLSSLSDVLVVGGCGFLGHHIVSLLLRNQPAAHISVLDLQTTRNRHNGVQYYDGDITDKDNVRTIFEKARPSVVIHTASPVFNANKRDVMHKVNVMGTKTLLDVAQERGVKAFVYTSSASVIHDGTSDLVNADERWPYVVGKQQVEYYTVTKILAEQAVLAANRSTPTFLTAAIRPSGMFGEGDVQFIPPVVRAYRDRLTHFQIGNNDNLFDMTYVENVAHAHILCALALLDTHKLGKTIPLDHEKVDGETFFITNDSPVYFWDWARAVWRAAGDTTPVRDVWVLNTEFAMAVGAILEWSFWLIGRKARLTKQQVKYSSMTRYFSIVKAGRRLGYHPIVSLEEGVRRSVNWFLEMEKEEAVKKDQCSMPK